MCVCIQPNTLHHAFLYAPDSKHMTDLGVDHLVLVTLLMQTWFYSIINFTTCTHASIFSSGSLRLKK